MKTALVISGGGSKGAFAVGAVERLRADGITFDLISGTSTGSLIAPLAAIDDIQTLRALYTQLHTEDLIKQRGALNILTDGSVYDAEPLWQLINSVITVERYNELIASIVEVYLTTVNLQTGKTEYWNQHQSLPIGHPPDGIPLDHGTLKRAMMASACQPVLMPLVPIPEDGNQYTDGGVREIAPLSIAVEQGAEKVFAVVLSPETREPKDETYRIIVKTLLRTFSLFTEEIALNDVNRAVLHNRAINYLKRLRDKADATITPAQVAAIFDDPGNPDPFAGKRLVELYLIRPKKDLPIDGLECDPAVMSQIMTMGSVAAEQALANGPISP